MSAKSIVSSVFGKLMKHSAKSIVLDAIEQAGVSSSSETDMEGQHQSQENDSQKVIEFTFSLDPDMVAELGAAMPKGAKPDDRSDSLNPDDEETSQDHEPPAMPSESEDEQSHTGKVKLTSDREFDQDDPVPEDDGNQVAVNDEALALDSRHTNTPIENCRAEDPMFCPYHGAQRMQQMIEDNIKKNIGANTNAVVEVVKNGSDFTARVTYPSTVTAAEQQGIEQAIQSFMTTKGIKNSSAQLQSSQNQITSNKSTEGQFSTQSLKERMPQGATPTDYDVAKAKQDLGIINEWMDDLIEDFGDPNSDIDPTDLENLMTEQDELEGLVNQLASTGGNAGLSSQFRAAKQQFEEQYHDVRGIADLPQIKTAQDAVQMRDDIAGERHKAGDWWNAKEEIIDLRKQLGLMNGNRALPMKTILSKYPALFDGWDKYKTKYENLFMGSLKKILGDGRTDMGANGKFEDAQKNGDLRKMKGALHTLKYATEEYTDLMPSFMKAMQAHKDDLMNYAKQQGITVTPYTQKQAPQPQTSNSASAGSATSQSTSSGAQQTATLADVQNAVKSVPAGVVQNTFTNQVGIHYVEFSNGNGNYAQSLLPSLQKQMPNNIIKFIPANMSSNGYPLIEIS